MRSIVLALAVAACGTPTPQILLAWAGPPAQACPSVDCSAIPLSCDAVMSLRIVDPSDPSHEYHSQCDKIQHTRSNMCSLLGISLEPTPIPVREVEVQIAVFPLSALPLTDSDDLDCPTDVEYNATTGYPVEQPGAPALGGRAYYHPGDETVDVTLGCTNLSAVSVGPGCASGSAGKVTARVDDFRTRLPVTVGPQGVASYLWVSVGEPHVLDGRYVLNPTDIARLRFEGGEAARWSDTVTQTFSKYVCVEVVEDIAQTTPSLRCSPAPIDPAVDLLGMRIDPVALHSVLNSLGLQDLPPEGLTIGMVVDSLANGAANYVVTPSAGTVRYVSSSGLGGTTTSSSGIFVSLDAPFGTKFSAIGPSATVPAIGGRVAGKVTLVIVPFAGATPGATQ